MTLAERIDGASVGELIASIGSRAAAADRCRAWNAEHGHQVMAGKARAEWFTPEHQVMATYAQ